MPGAEFFKLLLGHFIRVHAFQLSAFPLDIEEGKATSEIACGTIERPADGEEAPALNWVDVTGLSTEDDTRPMGAYRVVGEANR